MGQCLGIIVLTGTPHADRRVKLSLLMILLLFGCSTRPHVAQYDDDFTGSGEHAVYIAHHGWHTGIVIPGEAARERLPGLGERFDEAPYLEFGWGDKEFYQADQMNSGLGMRAGFWPTDTVVRAVSVPENLGNYFAATGIVKLCANDAELASLLDFLASSFRMKEDDQLIPSENGSGRTSQFYAGTGDYYLINTCNTWTAKGLKSMGMDLSAILKPTANSVMNYLYNHEKAHAIRLLDEATSAPAQAEFSCQ